MVLLMLVFQMFFSLSLSAQQSEVYMNSADFKHGLELLTNPDAPDEEGAMESLLNMKSALMADPSDERTLFDGKFSIEVQKSEGFQA